MNWWRKVTLGCFISVVFGSSTTGIRIVSRMGMFSPTDDAPSSSFNITRDSFTTSIRRWGCHRKETPFIFVHIGKSGGGSIRSRIAAAAQDYNREQWHAEHIDHHRYPIEDDSGRHAKFCNSKNSNYMLPHKVEKSFEGTLPCHATTPIGHAIGCPTGKPKCLGCRDMNSTVCDTVYVGHNFFGNEMHWLPPRYLQRWWHNHSWSNNKNTLSESLEKINRGFHSITPNKEDVQWCPKYNISRPMQRLVSISLDDRKNLKVPILNECSTIAARRADIEFQQYWDSLMAKPNNYSPLYASLPLHRAVMLREPFSWLQSKFFWHRFNRQYACDDIQSASRKDTGWAYGAVMNYTMYLCGEDCMSRVETNIMTFEEATEQAESNLRNSFSVVGLLNETESFYDMITTRISYMNMSLNPEVQGRRHSSKGRNETESTRCSKIYENVTFQQRFKEELPILASLEQLYHVGVEVNRFQKEELSQCR